MSRFADENRPFIKVIRELPKRISSMGYTPIDPRIINSRSGVYMTILALFRLPEVDTDHDFLSYITGNIGKDLNIDPFELLTPQDYRTVSGTKKLEYRTNADSRAYSMINELVNDCKVFHRELESLKRQTDLPEKIAHIVDKASITFKRIVSIKEFSFGGAYLLDEDIYEHLTDFSNQLYNIVVLSYNSIDYTTVSDLMGEYEKIVRSRTKMEALKSDEFKKTADKIHSAIIDMRTRFNKKIDEKKKMIRVIQEARHFTEEFNKRAKSAADFDITVFKAIPDMLKVIEEQYDRDLTNLAAKFNSLFGNYADRTPEPIRSKGNVNPSHLKNICKKYFNTVLDFLKGTEPFISLNHQAEFGNTLGAINSFYTVMQKKYAENKCFRDSVDKSFKFKKGFKSNNR